MSIKNKEQIKAKVEQILRDYPETRNCDKKLFFKYWELYDGIAPYNQIDYDKFIDRATNPVTIHRVRAMIQNEERHYLPTDWRVAEARNWNRQEWLDLIGRYLPKEGESQANLFGGGSSE